MALRMYGTPTLCISYVTFRRSKRSTFRCSKRSTFRCSKRSTFRCPKRTPTYAANSQADFIKKPDAPWHPMDASVKLISTTRTPDGGYSITQLISSKLIPCDPVCMPTKCKIPSWFHKHWALKKLILSKLTPYWWAVQPFMDAGSKLSSSNLTPHGCYYATSSRRIDAPSVIIWKLIPATSVHGWVKGTLFGGWVFNSLTWLCWPCWHWVGGLLIQGWHYLRSKLLASALLGPKSVSAACAKSSVVARTAVMTARTTLRRVWRETLASLLGFGFQPSVANLGLRGWSWDAFDGALQVQFAAENAVAISQSLVLVTWASAIVKISKLTFAVRQFRGTFRCCTVCRAAFASVKAHFIAELVSWTHLARCSMPMPSREALAECFWQKPAGGHLDYRTHNIFACVAGNLISVRIHVCGLQLSFL